MGATTDFGRCVTRFLTTHLVGEMGRSQRTVQSYAATMKALVAHLGTMGVKPEKIELSHVNSGTVRSFLDGMEEAGCSASTRNQRLSAVKAFARFAISECPHYMMEGQRVIAISSKRCAKHEVEYLERDALCALLAVPDQGSAVGRRELACMALLYDSAARVQELIDLEVGCARLLPPATVTLTGKGSKTRTVPITQTTANLLRSHLADRGIDPKDGSASKLALVAPPGRARYTRPGIAKMLSRNLERAREENPELRIPASIHPHMLRASKAIHLLDEDVGIILIRDFLGHASVSTTQVYLRVNSEVKRRAVRAVSSNIPAASVPGWRSDADLMSFLKELSKG